MRIDILSAVPRMLESFFAHSIMFRARQKNILDLHLHDLHDYTTLAHQQIDDYAYGGDAGMVLMAEPIVRAIETLTQARAYDEIIYFSPDGEKFTQTLANNYSLCENIILLCGHYKGVDERVRERYITREISIGEYVVSGGELAAAVFADSVVRLIPKVLGDEQSALHDSFQDGRIAPPVYTRPAVFRGMEVPSVLMGGNHKLIRTWQDERADEATKLWRARNQKKDE